MYRKFAATVVLAVLAAGSVACGADRFSNRFGNDAREVGFFDVFATERITDLGGDDTYDSPGDDTFYDSPGDDTLYDSPGDDTFFDVFAKRPMSIIDNEDAGIVPVVDNDDADIMPEALWLELMGW